MPNVIEFLRGFRQGTLDANRAGQEHPEYEQVLSMTADEFRQQSLAILVRSYLFGEDILLVSNAQCLGKVGDSHVVYLPEELEALLQHSPEFIRRVHRLKKCVNGEIITQGVI